MITTQVNTNPFPGLRPFSEKENYLFFGRETQVDEMVKKLSKHRFLAVIGTSGSGKSSLVNCGLFPALQGGYLSQAGTSWRIAKFRPGNNPIQELSNSLAKKGTLFMEEKVGNLPISSMLYVNLLRSKLGLIETYKQARLKPNENLLVVADQFEELFRYQKLRAISKDKDDNSVSFVNLLLEAVRQTDLPIYLVITMRSDFLGDCSRFRGLPEMINKGQYLVPRMKREERKSAIAGPVKVAGANMTDRLLMRLVNDVGDNPDQLSILQHALNRTWAAWEKEGDDMQPLDLTHYQRVGTMANALDQHAEKAYNELPNKRHKLVCKKIFKALTDVGVDSRGVRRPTKMKLLCAIAEATPEEVQTVIDVFRKPSRSFLMPPFGQAIDEGTIVDISHESFMRIWKRLIRWTKEEQESVRTYLRLSDQAVLYQEGKISLLTDPYLQFAQNWKEEEKVNEAWTKRYDNNYEIVLDYLRKSRREKQLLIAEERAEEEAEKKRKDDEQRAKIRRARKINRIVGISGAICLLLLIATGIMYKRADNAKTIAENAEKSSNDLKAEILHRMGFTEKDVVIEDLDQIFDVKDIQESIKVIENGTLRSTDEKLLALYNTLLDDNYRKFLIDSTRTKFEMKASILSGLNEIQNAEDSPSTRLSTKLDNWERFTSVARNSPEYELGIDKLASYQEKKENQAYLAHDSLIYVLDEEYRSITKDSLPQPVNQLKLGNGRSLHVWINGENENAKVDFYAGDSRIGTRNVARNGFPSWTQQFYDPSHSGKTGYVKVYNRSGDLLGEKSFKLLR